ncbi:hypothetical protein MPDQ_004070 [Monascus purpureus]|uniref:Ubiquitin 3 binding protein But2 C-terminal domain-containing protein n=1 Tax=Monascus purpureus TaxID=5098 RepID=A0A507QLI8_MONPU|nr:hypothetical protein MPDQ_004070 [Monascus purpureus]BDD54748.1 hypothetical protein MAP00_000339 [Monascus purpureus]
MKSQLPLTVLFLIFIAVHSTLGTAIDRSGSGSPNQRYSKEQDQKQLLNHVSSLNKDEDTESKDKTRTGPAAAYSSSSSPIKFTGERIPGGSGFHFCDSREEREGDVFEIEEVGISSKPEVNSIVFFNMSGTFHDNVSPNSTINVTTIINGRRTSRVVDFCSFAQTVEQRSPGTSSSFSFSSSRSHSSSLSLAAGQGQGGSENQNHIHACPPHRGWGVIRRGDSVFVDPEGVWSFFLDAYVPDGRRLFCIVANVEMD